VHLNPSSLSLRAVADFFSLPHFHFFSLLPSRFYLVCEYDPAGNVYPDANFRASFSL
jgi:hypothetical protein